LREPQTQGSLTGKQDRHSQGERESSNVCRQKQVDMDMSLCTQSPCRPLQQPEQNLTTLNAIRIGARCDLPLQCPPLPVQLQWPTVNYAPLVGAQPRPQIHELWASGMFLGMVARRMWPERHEMAVVTARTFVQAVCRISHPPHTAFRGN